MECAEAEARPALVRGHLRSVAARAMGWQTLSTILVQVLQSATTMVLAARIAPQEFALWGVASILFNAQYLIGSLGLGPALIFHGDRERTQDAVDGAAVITGGMGLLAGVALFVAAPAVATVFTKGFSRHDVIGVVRLMSLVFVFATAANVPQALIERTLDFRRRAVVEIVAVGAYVLFAGLMLSAGYGVWSLITAKVVQMALLAVLSWVAAPVRPRALPRLHWDVIGSLFRYGKFVSAAAVLGFAVGNLDNVAIGRLAGATALGAYALAYTVANIVPTFLTLTLGKVFFPLYASIRDDREALRRMFAAAAHYVGVVMLPTTIGLMSVVPPALIDIFGDKWRPAVALVQILALYGLARSCGAATTTLLNAVGRPDLVLRVQAAALAVPTLLLWPLSGLGGEGIAIAFTVGQLGAAGFALACSREYWTPDLVRQLGGPALAGGGALLAVYALQTILPQPLSGWTELLTYGAFCSIGLVAADRRVRGSVGMLLQHLPQLSAVAVVPEPVRPGRDATPNGGGHGIVDRVYRDEVR